MSAKLLWFSIAALLLSGCGPFRNKYADPTDQAGSYARIEISYTGDFAYPRPLFFGEGKTCSHPQVLDIKPLGSTHVAAGAGEVASFMLGDLTPATATGAGLSVGICNMAFTFTVQAGHNYKIIRNRTKKQCVINVLEVSSSGAQDITSTIIRREYSVPFWDGDGPRCK